jgi:hypothetical protein
MYKISFVVADDGAEADFVFFDRVGRELVGLPLITLLRYGHGHAPGTPLAQIVEAARGDVSTPKELASVVSCKFRFVVSISNKRYASEEDEVSFQVHRFDAPLDKQALCFTVPLPQRVALAKAPLRAALFSLQTRPLNCL